MLNPEPDPDNAGGGMFYHKTPTVYAVSPPSILGGGFLFAQLKFSERRKAEIKIFLLPEKSER